VAASLFVPTVPAECLAMQLLCARCEIKLHHICIEHSIEADLHYLAWVVSAYVDA
jgi:hypothetical protein